MVKTFNLDSKIVLITGGYGYLGKAVTESLVFHGAKVYVLGKDESKFNSVFSENLKLNLHFKHCDISSSSSISSAFKSIFEVEKRIDTLINNAFYSKGQSPESMSDEDWLHGIEGSLNSVFRCIREIIPYFNKNKSGKIINVSSMYGIVAPEFDVYSDYPNFLNPPHYGAAKAGVIQLTKYYASYLGKQNINVNCVTPGPFPSTEVQKEKGFIDELSKKTCLNRIGAPEDLGGAFVFLTSESSNFITGQNIVVDGGWTTK